LDREGGGGHDGGPKLETGELPIELQRGQFTRRIDGKTDLSGGNWENV